MLLYFMVFSPGKSKLARDRHRCRLENERASETGLSPRLSPNPPRMGLAARMTGRLSFSQTSIVLQQISSSCALLLN